MKFLLIFLAFGSSALAYPLVPNPALTPGSLCTIQHSEFTEFRYPEKIPYCRRNVSTSDRARIYESYGIDGSERSQYTIDHLIPLSIGGDNSDLNLWPEHAQVKRIRQNAEQELHIRLRDAKWTQEQAVGYILHIKRTGTPVTRVPQLPPGN